jgi:hypothetical protein
MNDLCADIGYKSLIKYGEQLCGDMLETLSPNENSTVVVLADGLGSGVKANILATLTSKIISTMMANSMSVEECVATVADTLPACKVRGVAYSTFTILRIEDNKEAEIIQYDNPRTILLRDGKELDYPYTTTVIGGKNITKAHFTVQDGDVFVLMSDGVIHAGVERTLNYGWQRENVVQFMEEVYRPDMTANGLNMLLIDECNRLYDSKPGDDTTVCTIKIRKRNPINLLFGPPENPADVGKMMSLFFSKEGAHIVCGGTTSQLAADFLGKTVEVDLSYMDSEIPPIARIEGVDLVTEGVVTMSKVLEYAKSCLDTSDIDPCPEWTYSESGASKIAMLLFEEATDINFYVGRAINPAHQNPKLPINFSIKMRIVEELSQALTAMGKRIKVSYF